MMRRNPFQYFIYIIVLLVLVLGICSCFSSRRGDEIEENPIFTNNIVDIRGKSSGLPEKWKRVYLTIFADFIGDLKIQKDFDLLLQQQLNQFGLITVSKIPQADAVISGSLETLDISLADRATNIPGLLYLLKVNYSVYNSDKSVLQKNQQIQDEILVVDTNAYLSNIVVDMLVQDTAKHTAEGIYYGWQLDYSKTDTFIKTLGAKIESNYSTNWSK